jgi:competence ComEA-like helix-hairpin-helix protein
MAAPPPLPPKDRRAAHAALASFAALVLGLLALRGYVDPLAARPTEARPPTKSTPPAPQLRVVSPQTEEIELQPRVRAQAPPDPPPARVPGVRKIQPGEPPIDVNTADAAELQRLPGVGPVTAAAIVAGRPYRSVAELDRVRGIGPKTLEKLRPFVAVGR